MNGNLPHSAIRFLFLLMVGALSYPFSAQALVMSTLVQGNTPGLPGKTDSETATAGQVITEVSDAGSFGPYQAISAVNDAGSFAASASGAGTFFARANVTVEDTIVNTTGSNLDVDYTFTVFPGGLFATRSTDGLTGGNATSQYRFLFFSGGTALIDSHGFVDNTNNGFIGDLWLGGTYTEVSDAVNQISTTSYTWGQQIFTLDLGTLAPGESFDVSYSLTVEADGNHAFPQWGGAVARYGDPAGFGTNPSGVPGPASFLLFGIGLVGLGIARNRK